MKTIMILGASYTQLPLFAAAKRFGCRTIAASIPGPYPCFEAADEAAYINIADPDAVTEAAKQYQIDGIATCGLDLGMRALGAAAEACGIPGPSREAALCASNKYRMKEAFMAHGVRTARFYRISNAAELERAMELLTFPVLLKAVDQMGSRGIFYCETKEAARVNLPKTLDATQKDYCLIEEFIRGELFGVEAMVQNGEILFLLPNNSESTKTIVQSPVGHSYPLRDREQIEDDLQRQVTGAIRALGLDNCPVNCDCMRSGDQVYLIEMTGRSGATGLSEMTSQYLGADYYELIVRLALGEDLRAHISSEAYGTANDSLSQNAEVCRNPGPSTDTVEAASAKDSSGAGSSKDTPDVSSVKGTPGAASHKDTPEAGTGRAAACLTHTLMAGGTGIVARILNNNPPADDILDLSFNIDAGDEVHPYTNGRDRIGQIFLTGGSLAACESRLQELLANLRLKLTDGTVIPCL